MAMNRHQVSIAAESFAAGVFAHAGYSVFVQYGANQPGFDLVVSDSTESLMVSVKGSTDGGWLLATKKPNGSYVQALETWIERNHRMVFCLVQFKDVLVGQCPRIWMVTGANLGEYLRTHYFGNVSLSLYERYEPKSGKNKGKYMGIPGTWSMTQARIDALFRQHAQTNRTNR